MMALPHLELSDHHRSPFDEAVLIVGRREENTITIACDGSLDVADELIRWCNNQERVLTALTAAEMALAAVEQGSATGQPIKIAPELIQAIAALCKQLKELTGAAA